jgi:polyisoprenoid-binding protein YceI
MSRSFRRIAAGLVILVCAFTRFAEPQQPPLTTPAAATYRISPVYSNVSFSIMKFFFTEEGGFGAYNGTIRYDPSHPEKSEVRMSVQAASIDTRNSNRDAVLRSEDFFDAQKYPALSFVSTSVTLRSNNELELTGDLTIHGITRQISMPVKFLGAKQMPGWGDFVGFDTVFTIDRTAFGVNGAKWSGGRLILSHDVTIHLAIGAVKE